MTLKRVVRPVVLSTTQPDGWPRSTALIRGRCGRGSRCRHRDPEGDNGPEPRGGESHMERARFGREAELARVSSFLDAVPNGPHALVLGGEAGIGKSAVWLDALEDARARSYRVLSSRPTEAEAKLSFAAVGDLLDGVVDEVLDAISAPQRTALEIALLRTEAGPTPPDRRTLSSAFHGALIALAEAGPLVLAVD